MLIPYLALLGLAIFGIRFAGKGFFREDFFSRPVTDTWKGISIWLVFFSHFMGYIALSSPMDAAGKAVADAFGQLIVVCFLFFSGYGVCEAIQKKGAGYVRSFPKNRIGKTLLHFALAVLLYLGLGLALGKRFTAGQILLSLIGWDSLGNSNWYIFIILCLYGATWIGFSLCKGNLKRGALFTTALCLALAAAMYLTRPSHWYDTLLCYPLGLWLSLYKKPLLDWLTGQNRRWALVLAGGLVLFAGARLLPRLSLPGTWLMGTLAAPIAFCLLLTTLLLKVRVCNKALIWSGQYTFEIYILQRLPMTLLQAWGVDKIHTALYFPLCLLSTLALAVVFRWAMNGLDHLLFKK